MKTSFQYHGLLYRMRRGEVSAHDISSGEMVWSLREVGVTAMLLVPSWSRSGTIVLANTDGSIASYHAKSGELQYVVTANNVTSVVITAVQMVYCRHSRRRSHRPRLHSVQGPNRDRRQQRHHRHVSLFRTSMHRTLASRLSDCVLQNRRPLWSSDMPATEDEEALELNAAIANHGGRVTQLEYDHARNRIISVANDSSVHGWDAKVSQPCCGMRE